MVTVFQSGNLSMRHEEDKPSALISGEVLNLAAYVLRMKCSTVANFRAPDTQLADVGIISLFNYSNLFIAKFIGKALLR